MSDHYKLILILLVKVCTEKSLKVVSDIVIAFAFYEWLVSGYYNRQSPQRESYNSDLELLVQLCTVRVKAQCCRERFVYTANFTFPADTISSSRFKRKLTFW